MPPLGSPRSVPLCTPPPSLMFQPVSGRRGSAGRGLATAATGPSSSTWSRRRTALQGRLEGAGRGRGACQGGPPDPEMTQSVSPLNTTGSSSCRPSGPDATSEKPPLPATGRFPFSALGPPPGKQTRHWRQTAAPRGSQPLAPAPQCPWPPQGYTLAEDRERGIGVSQA